MLVTGELLVILQPNQSARSNNQNVFSVQLEEHARKKPWKLMELIFLSVQPDTTVFLGLILVIQRLSLQASTVLAQPVITAPRVPVITHSLLVLSELSPTRRERSALITAFSVRLVSFAKLLVSLRLRVRAMQVPTALILVARPARIHGSWIQKSVLQTTTVHSDLTNNCSVRQVSSRNRLLAASVSHAQLASTA